MKITQDAPMQLVLQQNSNITIFFGIVFAAIGIGVAVSVSGPSSMTARIIGGVFVLAGILMVVTAKSYNINIDKSQNKATFLTSAITGQKSQDIALDQFKELALEESISTHTSSHGTNTQIRYSLVFYLRDGEGISIPIGAIPIGNMLGRNKNVVLANKIAGFIGVPFVDRRPLSVTEVINTTDCQ